MPGITNYLTNLNKRLEISSTEINNVELKESFVLNSRRVAADLSSVGAYLNSVIVQSYSELCSRPSFPYDAVVHGLSGMTIKVWPEALGNNKFNSPIFWFGSENPDVDGRPTTIKESLQYLWENLNDRIIESRETPVDLAPLYDQISCLNEMLSRLKADSFGEDFILNCLEGYTKQKWPISKHIYEVLTQLTTGHNTQDLTGLNNVDNDYPGLQWNIALEDLLDVDIESLAPTSGDALVYNQESYKWVPGTISEVEFAYQLKDVDYGLNMTKASDGQILRWRGGDPDGDGGDEGAWVPEDLPSSVSGDDLFGTDLCPGETLADKDFLVYTHDCGGNPSVSSPGWVAQNRYNPIFSTKLPFASPARSALWNKDTEDLLNIDWDNNTIFPGLVGVASEYEISKLWSINLDIYNTTSLTEAALKSGNIISYVLTADRLIDSLIGKVIGGVPSVVQTANSTGEGVALYDPSYHTASELLSLQSNSSWTYVEPNLLQQNVTNFFLSRLNRTSITELADVNTTDGNGPVNNELLVWQGSELDDSGLETAGCWKPKGLNSLMTELGIPIGGGSSTLTLDHIVESNSKVEVIDDGTDKKIEFTTDNTKRWEITETGHILPSTNADYDIGSAEKKVRHLFLSDNSLHMGDNILSSNGGDLKWNGSFTIPVYSGVPDNNNVLKWDGSNWHPSPETISSNTSESGCFEDSISGSFTTEVLYDQSGYNLGVGASPCMFQFQNKTGAAMQIKNFSFFCKKMFSSTIKFCFVQSNSAELVTNVFHTASDLQTLTRSNEDVNNSNLGVGLLEGSGLNIDLPAGDWVAVLLNFYEKVSLDNEDWYCQLMWDH